MAPLPSLSSLAIALLLLATQAYAGGSSVQFAYSGAQGPDKWGNLSPEFSACSAGKMQSPIDITTKDAVVNKKLKILKRDYKPANATLVNNGFNVGIHYESYSGSMNIDGKTYNLRQMHWHIPSEHRIDGVQYAAELHLVHEADDGSLSVVAILFESGDEDSFLEKIEDELEDLAKEVCGGDEDAHIPLGILDNKLLRKNTRKYYRYVGSLTTPPCTENVMFNVLGKVRSISKKQVAALQAPLSDEYKLNCRPVQPLNGRKVELYSELE